MCCARGALGGPSSWLGRRFLIDQGVEYVAATRAARFNTPLGELKIEARVLECHSICLFRV